jgi:hypothetical protein
MVGIFYYLLCTGRRAVGFAPGKSRSFFIVAMGGYCVRY